MSANAATKSQKRCSDCKDTFEEYILSNCPECTAKNLCINCWEDHRIVNHELGVAQDDVVTECEKRHGLMQVIEHIIGRHERGECHLDEETFKLFEIAKSINRAKTGSEFQLAIDNLE